MRESGYVRDTQIDPVAGIWACDNCGRRIQLIQDSNVRKVQAFICVCGKEMRPGEEHATGDDPNDARAKGDNSTPRAQVVDG
jgi:hypothetical protein